MNMAPGSMASTVTLHHHPLNLIKEERGSPAGKMFSEVILGKSGIPEKGNRTKTMGVSN